MPDFGPRWTDPQALSKGGQAQTFIVSDAENLNSPRRVAKILNNPKQDRKGRFVREIEVTKTFDHQNVVRSLGSGETRGSKWPYFIMPYYERGTLEENYGSLGTPIERLRLFLAICEGVAYAHGLGLVHRDLKPANIFMADSGAPVVGDFGLCYRATEDAGGRNTQTTEAVGARKYMPPEWREGRAEIPQATGDVYSLGKVLYWMFVGRVFDGHEDDHSTEHPILKTNSVLKNQILQEPQRWTIAWSVVDELVSRTVLKRAGERIDSVGKLIEDVRSAIDRVESGGRVLDFNLPKRCVFCAAGTYVLPPNHPFFPRAIRINPPPSRPGEWPFRTLQQFVKNLLGFGLETPGAVPICLVCSTCGNINTSDSISQPTRPARSGTPECGPIERIFCGQYSTAEAPLRYRLRLDCRALGNSSLGYVLYSASRTCARSSQCSVQNARFCLSLSKGTLDAEIRALLLSNRQFRGCIQVSSRRS